MVLWQIYFVYRDKEDVAGGGGRVSAPIFMGRGEGDETPRQHHP